MKTETYNKLKIALAVICFLIAAMFVAYAVIFIYNAVRVIFATEGANYGEYDYGVLLIFYVVIKPLSKIATAVCCAWFIFVIVIYLLDGISFIKKQSEYTEFKSRKRSLRLSFVFSVIHLIPLSIVVCVFGIRTAPHRTFYGVHSYKPTYVKRGKTRGERAHFTALTGIYAHLAFAVDKELGANNKRVFTAFQGV